MSYSDIFVCLFKHVTQVGALREIPDYLFFFNILPLESLKLHLKKLYKTNIFTLSGKYWPTSEVRGEREKQWEEQNDLFCTEIGQQCLLGEELVFHWIFN